MKPNEVRCEVPPGRVNASPLLEVGKCPAVAHLLLVPGNLRTSLRKARVGENQHGQSLLAEYSVKSVHGRLKLWRVHKNVVRNHNVELRVTHGSEFSAGINPKIDTRMVGSGNFDHAVG